MVKIVLGMSILSFVVACATPAFKNIENNRENSFTSIDCLAIGWMSILLDVFMFLAWCANVFYGISLTRALMDKNDSLTLILSASAFLLSFFALTVKKLPKNEGGDMVDVKVGIGFYFWVASFLVLVIYELCFFYLK